jgi:hypothetical protein
MKKVYLLFLLVLFPTLVLAYTNEKSATIKITDNNQMITSFFGIENTSASWSVEDASIASIVDNKIIPIKTGNTDIKTTINSDTYILHLEVVNEEVAVTKSDKDINTVMKDVKVTNPQTGDEIMLLALVIVISFITIVFFKSRMNQGKYEDE